MLVRSLVVVSLLEHGMFVDQECAIFKCRLAALGMTGQVIVCTVRNPFDFVKLLFFVSFRKESI